eukprot:scaffold53827_cov28-Tisochrysis_lutea.AAC.10
MEQRSIGSPPRGESSGTAAVASRTSEAWPASLTLGRVDGSCHSRGGLPPAAPSRTDEADQMQTRNTVNSGLEASTCASSQGRAFCSEALAARGLLAPSTPHCALKPFPRTRPQSVGINAHPANTTACRGRPASISQGGRGGVVARRADGAASAHNPAHSMESTTKAGPHHLHRDINVRGVRCGRWRLQFRIEARHVPMPSRRWLSDAPLPSALSAIIWNPAAESIANSSGSTLSESTRVAFGYTRHKRSLLEATSWSWLTSRSSLSAARSSTEHICVGCHGWPGNAASFRLASAVIADSSGETRCIRSNSLKCASDFHNSSLMMRTQEAASSGLAASRVHVREPKSSNRCNSPPPATAAAPAGTPATPVPTPSDS